MNNPNSNLLLVFANNLKRLRKGMDLSQEGLAELAGMHRTYIGMIERCEKNITLNNIAKLAEALNIEASELLKSQNGSH